MKTSFPIKCVQYNIFFKTEFFHQKFAKKRETANPKTQKKVRHRFLFRFRNYLQIEIWFVMLFASVLYSELPFFYGKGKLDQQRQNKHDYIVYVSMLVNFNFVDFSFS